MIFTIRPAGSSRTGGFAVSAVTAREALNVVEDMRARGLRGIMITDENGRRYGRAELERLVTEADRLQENGATGV